MMQSHFVRRGVACALALTATLAIASGSDGGSTAETGNTAAYNSGKSVYAIKLACGNCPLAGKSLDASAARELLTNKRGVALSSDEAQALDFYLKRRFRLRTNPLS